MYSNYAVTSKCAREGVHVQGYPERALSLESGVRGDSKGTERTGYRIGATLPTKRLVVFGLLQCMQWYTVGTLSSNVTTIIIEQKAL